MLSILAMILIGFAALHLSVGCLIAICYAAGSPYAMDTLTWRRFFYILFCWHRLLRGKQPAWFDEDHQR